MRTIENNLCVILERVADRNPDKAALVFHEKTVTFGELKRDVRRCSCLLREKGVLPGERIIIMLPMSPDLYVTLLAIISVGAIAVFVDPWIGVREIARFAAFADPVGFIGVPKSHIMRIFQKKLRRLKFTLTTGKSLFHFPAKYSIKEIYSCNDTVTPAPVSLDETALITFTSGSSGVPKGANRTHGFLLAQYNALSRELSYDDTCVDLCMFPVFALRNLASGVTSVVPDIDFKSVSSASGERLVQQIEQFNVNTITASPPLIERVAEWYKERKEVPQINFFTGGAPVKNEQLRRWHEIFPQCSFTIVYGSTEAEPVSHIDSHERLNLEDREGFCCGVISDLLDWKIVTISKAPLSSEQLQSTVLPLGEIGELLVSGSHVCVDYYRNPSAVKENKVVDNNGRIWHRMGDTGYVDSERRFFLTGRVHSTIDRDGKIYHAQLVESEVLSMITAERVAALEIDRSLVVVIEGVVTEEERGRIDADRVIATSDTLPLDPRHNAKVDYEVLRKRIIDNRITIL